jgi:hypothetical protein
MKSKEVVVVMAGRNVGKSHFSAQALSRIMQDIMSRRVEDLVLSEGRVHGARYYCVEPVGGNWIDMEVWCLDTFGDPGKDMWSINSDSTPTVERWYMNNRKFWFRNERDRTMFIMRWSGQ